MKNNSVMRLTQGLLLCLSALVFICACDKYDDSSLRELIESQKKDIAELQKSNEDLQNKIENLQNAEKNVNDDISTLSGLVSALEKNKHISMVTPLEEGGYTITFTDGEIITIKDGKDGVNGEKGEPGTAGAAGQTPLISVAQSDGVYYWTLNGDWLLDDDGNKLPVTGPQGEKGEPGDSGEAVAAIAPQVRINTDTNEWEISTDNGETWKSTGVKATGEKGEKGDTGTAGKDGATPQLKIVDGNWMVSYDNGASWSMSSDATEGNVIKDIIVDESTHNFKIILTDGTEIPLYYGNHPYVELDKTSTTATAEGQTVTIKVNASDDYSVSCDDIWVTITNAENAYTITVAPNLSSAPRNSKILFNCRSTIAEFNISQEGYPVSGTNPCDSQMETVFIKAGTFMMGSPNTEFGRNTDETLHQVTLTQDFYIGKYKVTNAQYCEFLNAIGISSDGCLYIHYEEQGEHFIHTIQLARSDNWGMLYGNDGWAPASGYDNYPVTTATWYGANEYVKWIGGALPTEAQWEYACRAGSTTAYYFGDDSDSLGEYAWYYDNCFGRFHPVGQKKPNAWGLYDMHGNVLEWCADWYGSYSTSAVTDPTGPTSGSYRVLRGGSLNRDASNCRSAIRNYAPPEDSTVDGSGFRVCFPVE